MLKIALPNKGSLSEESLELIRDAGYRCRRYGKELIVRDPDNDVEFVFLRPRDIAVYASSGIIDLGITGRDLVRDSRADLAELLPLGFGKSRFCYAVPRDSDLTPGGLDGLRIATSYPHLVQQDLECRGQSARLVQLDGAVEIAIRLGVADAVADVVQSGRTLEQAGLKTVGASILDSEAVLVGRTPDAAKQGKARSFLDRVRGIVVAREYAMVEYDIAEPLLELACVLTPGIEAPTVAPLSRKGWLAVKAMAPKRDLNGVMDELAKLGAKGIIVTDIRTCRI
jgi:ATP phosphoribosyltransferase